MGGIGICGRRSRLSKRLDLKRKLIDRTLRKVMKKRWEKSLKAAALDSNQPSTPASTTNTCRSFSHPFASKNPDTTSTPLSLRYR